MKNNCSLLLNPKKNCTQYSDMTSQIFLQLHTFLGRYLLSLFIRSFFSYANRENYFRIAGPDYKYIFTLQKFEMCDKMNCLASGFKICHFHLLVFCVYKQKHISTNEAFVHFSKQLPDEFWSIILFYILSCKYQNCMRV